MAPNSEANNLGELTGYPEQCMKYVYHIPWSICNSTSFWILEKKKVSGVKKGVWLPFVKFGP